MNIERKELERLLEAAGGVLKVDDVVQVARDPTSVLHKHFEWDDSAAAQAKRRFTLADHAAATAGVECRQDEDVLDETPQAYKDIDAVMAAQADLVDIVHTLKQVLCVKG